MFIYSFKTDKNMLIPRVVITGEHLTLYVSKSLGSAELQPVITHFHLYSIIEPEHPAHKLLHNPFIDFSRKLDKVPHVHLDFPSENKLQVLKDICDFLIHRQKNVDLRKKDYQDYVNSVEEDRKDGVHNQFLANAEKSIKQYDCITPFLPEEEIHELLIDASSYLKSDELAHRSDLLAEYLEKMVRNNWDLCKKFLYGAPETAEEKRLEEYYDNINSLYFTLLKIIEQNQTQDLAQAYSLSQHILQSQYVNNLEAGIDISTFVENLRLIQKKLC